MAADPNVAGATAVPFTNDSLALEGNYLWEIVQPQENALTVTQGQVLTFQIPASTDAMTSIGQTFLQVQGFFDIANDCDFEANVGVTTNPFLAAWLFRDVTLDINNVNVLPSQGLSQPISHLANIIKNRSFIDRETKALTHGYFPDSEGTGGEWNIDYYPTPFPTNDPAAALKEDVAQAYLVGPQLSNLYQSGQMKRRVKYLEGEAATANQRLFSLTIPLSDLGFETSAWLPPNCTMRLRMMRGSDIALVKGPPTQCGGATGLGGANAAAPPFTFAGWGARVFVARKQLKYNALTDLTNAWVYRAMKMPYEKIRTSTSYFTADTANVNVVGVLTGPTPKCVMAFVQKVDAFNQVVPAGGGWAPAAGLAPQDESYWTNAYLSMGTSRTYPVQALNQSPSTRTIINLGSGGAVGVFAPLGIDHVNFDLSQIYAMYVATAHKYPFLKDVDFTNIQPLCFQITHESMNGWTEAEDVTLQFHGVFAGTVPAAAYVLTLVSFTDSIVEIRSTLETLVS